MTRPPQSPATASKAKAAFAAALAVSAVVAVLVAVVLCAVHWPVTIVPMVFLAGVPTLMLVHHHADEGDAFFAILALWSAAAAVASAILGACMECDSSWIVCNQEMGGLVLGIPGAVALMGLHALGTWVYDRVIERERVASVAAQEAERMLCATESDRAASQRR